MLNIDGCSDMRNLIFSILVLLAAESLHASSYRDFNGKIETASPSNAASAIDKAYCMFSVEQLRELRKKPEIILQYDLATWIENNWLAPESAPLYVWFQKHGIKIRSSMCLFVIRGFEFRLHGKTFKLEKELRNPNWNKVPPPMPPPLSSLPSSDQ